ncbi:transglycosylase SLT domain-containing protein [Nonomuraea sp. NPDC003804]|uniref:transglycosylase SLT domain-containing protein n=1 Tax=Nonomuraea sp. NPDC003804 TaxID=3154547 RepID=UPI0033AC63A1
MSTDSTIIITVTAPDITEVPRGAELQAMLDKVTGNPQGIRSLASTWRSCSHQAADVTSALIRNINEVDLKWEGDSADAFDRHMRLYPKAGGEFNTAVTACATALDQTATALEKASAEIRKLCDETVGGAQNFIGNYLVSHRDKDQVDAMRALPEDRDFTTLVNTKIELAKGHVKAAEEAVTAAKNTLAGRVQASGTGENSRFGFFSDIPYPGGADFDPGDKKVIWKRTTSSQGDTRLSGGDGSKSGGGAGAGGGSGSGGGVSPAGTTPAPKAEVVEWIKQALTVIKSPEMADVMRERGIDVNDLDPNDPQDVQRIWTIIYHESGGNPGAVNTWDINAKNGIPSQGLMQTIPPTFNAHALPGHGKILDPVDNIIAGVLYTYSRYGNLGGHPGIQSLERGGGYKPY